MTTDNFISKPIEDLDALLSWIPSDRSKRKTSFIKFRYNIPGNKTTKTLICHDMANGYNDDKFDQGSNSLNAYLFWQWRDIDMFIYFSHHFISIPPFVYRVAAHLNNIPILATFIVEGPVQLPNLRTILSPEISPKVISQLVLFAVEYQYDGYLINIETGMEVSLVPRLIDFLKNLKNAIETAIPHGVVIWYDSIIHDGRIRYQNGLNENNYIFFNNSHAFFTNYDWDANCLIDSKKYCLPERIPNIYIGIDFFCRNDTPVTRFLENCVQMLKYARHFDMSVAIFAIGFMYENLGPDLYFEKFPEFWERLKPRLCEHPIVSCPFKTNFCIGRGKHMYFLGNEVSDESFSNLSLQQLQPNFTKIVEGKNTSIRGLDEINRGICYDVSYTGGSSYKLCLELSASKTYYSINYLKYNLFNFDCAIQETIIISFTYLLSNPESVVGFALELEFFGSSSHHIFLKDATFSENFDFAVKNNFTEENVLALSADEYLAAAFNGKLKLKSQWKTQFSVIHEDLMRKGNLKSINLMILPNETDQSLLMNIWFGQFIMCPYSCLDVDWNHYMLSNIIASDIKIETGSVVTLTALLDYEVPKFAENDIDSIDIFHRTIEAEPNYLFIGKAFMTGTYFLKMKFTEVPSHDNIMIVFQIVLNSGIRMPIDTCPTLYLQPT